MNAMDVRVKGSLVLIHGAGCNKKVWQSQLRFFKGYCDVIAVDLPGHGDNNSEPFDRVDKYTFALREEIKKRVSGEFILCGHSMGGAIAQFYALSFPEDLNGLILVATGARLRVTHQIFETIEKDYNAFVELSVTFSIDREARDDVRAQFREIISRCNPSVVFKDFKACNNFDLMEKVDEIKVPTLVLSGENDLLTPVKYAKYLVEKIKGAKLQVFNNCGHMIMLEKPDEFNSAVLKFINDLCNHS